MVVTSWSGFLRALVDILDDALHRGTLFLLANTVATAAIGSFFCMLAAHGYCVPAIGAFFCVISGAGLLAAIPALGPPTTVTRRGKACTVYHRPRRTRPPPDSTHAHPHRT